MRHRLAPLALALVASLGLAAGALFAETQSFKRVSLVDTMCVGKVKADPDKHKRACALQCKGSGFGVLTDGGYLRFDDAGNQKAIAALEASDRKDTLRVDVSGTVEGEILKVDSLALVD
jgi:hypothetical protein